MRPGRFRGARTASDSTGDGLQALHGMPLPTLLALARQREEVFAQAEQAARARSTEDGLRQVQRAREQDEARRLLALRAAAFGALGPVCAALRLPAAADAVGVRARLQEWEQMHLGAEQHAATLHQLEQARLLLCAAAGVDTETRRAWDAIDAGDAAAQAHAQMEQSGAAIRSGMVPPPPGSRP